jgi:5-methylcytosine-specific restriction endonuclease McrA
MCSKESRKSKKVLHACVQCGNKTLNPKFCSRSCSATYNNTAVPKRIKKYNICPTCGHEHSRKKYCSDECNPKKLKLTEEEKYFYTRARQNEAWARYMAKKKNQTPKDADIRAIQEFYLNCPKGYEVDHIIPISKGGLHTLENLQYLTISENRRKSNKILSASSFVSVPCNNNLVVSLIVLE